MRLLVANCSVEYSGRLGARLPAAPRLIVLKADGSLAIHSDTKAYKPLNWMNPPCVITETSDRLVAVTPKGEQLTVELHEVLFDERFELGDDPGLAKDGVEAELQELLAAAPHWCGEGLRLIRREWPTDIGPVDLMCRDAADQWIAVEIKRIATIDAVEQLTRYLERVRRDPALGSCRGLLAAQVVKPQARVLAQARGMECVEVDLELLRGEREPELKLFAA